MSYERLELIDGVTKWDTEKVQHLEDAIIKNENDIQKYHNDTVVEMQADWNQEDETAKDYVKNRTHYTSINTISLVENFETECREYILGGGLDRVEKGLTNERFEGVVFDSTMDIESLQVFINGVQEPISRIEKQDSNTIYWYLSNGIYISVMNNNDWSIRLDYWTNTLEIGDKLNVSVFIDQVTVVPLDIKYIPDTIAKVTDIPVMDITLTNEGAAADAKAVGEAISNLENKVDNKQIEEYFEEVIGTETLIGSSYHGASIEVRPALFDRPINLKLVNKLSGKIFILKDEDFSGGRGEFNYEGPADLSFVIRFSGENVTFFEKGVNDSPSYDLYKIEFKTLDEKYISNTIVRKTELEEYFHVYEEELYVNSFEERMTFFLGQFLNEVKRPIRLKFVNTSTGEIQIVKEKDLNITYEGPSGGPTYEVITYNNPNGLIVQQFSMSSTDIRLEYFHGQCDDIVIYGLIPIDDKKELNEEYIPDTIARAPKATFDDIEEAPTASDFNTLLSILREAGILATE